MKHHRSYVAGMAGLALGLGLLAGCGSANDDADDNDSSAEVTLTDMTGREVTLPKSATKVFAAGPPATAMVYSFDPDHLAGWNSKVSDSQREFLTPEAADLPVLGRAFGDQGDFNPETLLEADVDLIVDAGNLDEEYQSGADDLQEQTGIPVIQLSTDPEDLAEAYSILGEALDDEDRAEEIGEKVERILDDLQKGSDNVTETKSIYYGQGENGLNTAPAGSIHSRVIEMIGATNAADVDLDSESGRAEVDFEQVLNWNPGVVVLAPDSPDSTLATDPAADADFGTLDAVASGDVFVSPAMPQQLFGWFDGPPSVNQLLGSIWAAEAVYPDAYDFDLVDEVQSFYADFYHYDMSTDQAEKILESSGVTP